MIAVVELFCEGFAPSKFVIQMPALIEIGGKEFFEDADVLHQWARHDYFKRIGGPKRLPIRSRMTFRRELEPDEEVVIRRAPVICDLEDESVERPDQSDVREIIIDEAVP